MNLEKYRKNNDFTYKELADFLGIDTSMAHRYCTGINYPELSVAYVIVRRTHGMVTFTDLLKPKCDNLNELLQRGSRRKSKTVEELCQ